MFIHFQESQVLLRVTVFCLRDVAANALIDSTLNTCDIISVCTAWRAKRALQLHILNSGPQGLCPQQITSIVIALSWWVFFFCFSFHSCFILLNHTPENSERCFFGSPVLKLPHTYSLYNDCTCGFPAAIFYLLLNNPQTSLSPRLQHEWTERLLLGNLTLQPEVQEWC